MVESLLARAQAAPVGEPSSFSPRPHWTDADFVSPPARVFGAGPFQPQPPPPAEKSRRPRVIERVVGYLMSH